MRPEHMHHGPHLFGIFAFLPGLFLLALVVVAVVIMLKRGRLGPVTWAPGAVSPGLRQQGTFWQHPEDEALQTLRMRLANGDITPEEYLERSTVLNPPKAPTS